MSYKTNLLVSTQFQVTMNLNFYKFDLFIECSLGRCDVSLLANETCERPKHLCITLRYIRRMKRKYMWKREGGGVMLQLKLTFALLFLLPRPMFCVTSLYLDMK
jgi:hypothetical protein